MNTNCIQIESMENLNPDPLATMMRENGYEPDNGDILLWPRHWPGPWQDKQMPSYVTLSGRIAEPRLWRRTQK